MNGGIFSGIYSQPSIVLPPLRVRNISLTLWSLYVAFGCKAKLLPSSAIIGSQGHAQNAQNLRDSGVNVVIGLYKKTSPSAKAAKKDGFEVLKIAEAVEAAKTIMVLVPDEFAPEVYAETSSQT